MTVTVVNNTASQRPKNTVVVFNGRRCESPGPLLPVQIKRVASLIDAPADVVARLKQVGELPQVLTVVSDPQAAGLGVDGHPPWIAMAERPDFPPRAFHFQEWVVGRDAVLHPRGRMINVDPQNFAEKIVCV